MSRSLTGLANHLPGRTKDRRDRFGRTNLGRSICRPTRSPRIRDCVSLQAVILDGARVFAVALQAMVDVERFRILLQGERDRKYALLRALRQDIGSVSAARQDSNVDDEHDPEGSTIAFELSQAAALLEQSRAGLEQIEAALERISDGSYGFCVVCGATIPEGRLEARPWTPFCIEHASGRS